MARLKSIKEEPVTRNKSGKEKRLSSFDIIDRISAKITAGFNKKYV